MKSANRLALAGLIILLAGCDSRQEPGRQTPATLPTATSSAAPANSFPATMPAATEASSDAAPPISTQPASSQLTIDGRVFSFPSAKLRVGRGDQSVVAYLYSDDPKAALKDDYVGNHFELMMKLEDVQDPHQIYMASWQYKAPSRDYINEPYGIFLEGMKYQLQPLDVSAHFLGDMLRVRIDLEGQFLMFENTSKSTAPRTVYVKGSLLAPIEFKD
jgi:hypothetical protein